VRLTRHALLGPRVEPAEEQQLTPWVLADARIGVHVGRERPQFLTERLDEVPRRLEQPALVPLPVRLEPRPVVVPTELGEERQPLSREALKSRRPS
jgi:hypothetical protein